MKVWESWEFLAHQILTGRTDKHAGNCTLNNKSQTGNKEAVQHVNVIFNQSVLLWKTRSSNFETVLQDWHYPTSSICLHWNIDALVENKLNLSKVDIAPAHFRDFFRPISSIHCHNTRGATRGDSFLVRENSLQYVEKNLKIQFWNLMWSDVHCHFMIFQTWLFYRFTLSW